MRYVCEQVLCVLCYEVLPIGVQLSASLFSSLLSWATASTSLLFSSLAHDWTLARTRHAPPTIPNCNRTKASVPTLVDVYCTCICMTPQHGISIMCSPVQVCIRERIVRQYSLLRLHTYTKAGQFDIMIMIMSWFEPMQDATLLH